MATSAHINNKNIIKMFNTTASSHYIIIRSCGSYKEHSTTLNFLRKSLFCVNDFSLQQLVVFLSCVNRTTLLLFPCLFHIMAILIMSSDFHLRVHFSQCVLRLFKLNQLGLLVCLLLDFFIKYSCRPIYKDCGLFDSRLF